MSSDITCPRFCLFRSMVPYGSPQHSVAIVSLGRRSVTVTSPGPVGGVAQAPPDKSRQHQEAAGTMPKNKDKGGKNRCRGSNENESEKREWVFKEDGQGYAQVIKMLGNR